MTDNNEKKVNEESEVQELNLIASCHRVDPISAVKQVALKQYVSFNFEWFIKNYMRNTSKESDIFATFLTLIQAEPEYYGNIIDILVEDHGIEVETIEQILQYIRSGIIPYNVWIDKLKADILACGDYYSAQSVPSLFLVYLLKTMRTSLIGFNKLVKALEEDEKFDEKLIPMINIAKIQYLSMPKRLKDEYYQAFISTDEEKRRLFQDNELSLFGETLIDMTRCPLDLGAIEEIEEGHGNALSKIWIDPPFGNGISVVNKSREPLPEKEGDSVEQQAPKKQKVGMGSFAIDVLGYGENGETPEELQKNETLEDRDIDNIQSDVAGMDEGTGHRNAPNVKVVYVVRKIAKNGSNRTMSENRFDTKEEAERFRREVLDAVPDIANAFDFRIDKEYV